ncbi:hypothetical protein HanIR_Chr17g0888441 [Helianthus annuus]|nr:hypothetical protein HanIR_Chr17g0888441 [Helianthus annuus]
MMIRRVSKLPYFLNNIFAFFSLSRHEQNLVVHDIFTKCAYEIKHTFGLLMFMALSLCIVTVFSRGSSNQAIDSEEYESHSNHFLPVFELHPLCYEVDEEVLEETHSLGYDQEFIPRLVQLELIEGATGRHEDYKESVPCLMHVKQTKRCIGSDSESEELHGYDSFEDDN